MAAQTIPVFSGTLQPGTRTLPPTSIPVGDSVLTLSIDRANWTAPAVTASMSADLSFDGGVTWLNGWVAFTAIGGPNQAPTPINPNPNMSFVTTDLGDPNNANRKIRASVTTAGGPLTTTVTVTLA
jgi:hypothetical protein